jgi:dephospho-CoA kinase
VDLYTETNNNFFRLIEASEMKESINDKFLFKSIILAGGPGSGKSYISKIALSPDKITMASSDVIFEMKLTKAGLGKKLDPANAEVYKSQLELRDKAKAVNDRRVANAVSGMLPIAVESTGQREGSITEMKEQLESFGYDVAMIFVNTNLETAKERNRGRERVLDDSVLEGVWKNAQRNKGKFEQLFGNNFIEINNDPIENKESVSKFKNDVLKRVRAFLHQPVQNPTGKRLMEKVKSSGGSYLSDIGIEVVFK